MINNALYYCRDHNLEFYMAGERTVIRQDDSLEGKCKSKFTFDINLFVLSVFYFGVRESHGNLMMNYWDKDFYDGEAQIVTIAQSGADYGENDILFMGGDYYDEEFTAWKRAVSLCDPDVDCPY